ncbi:hypothetical protein KK488_03140 [Sphingobium sp. H33]|uniref:Uncharacterized protein n=1 Tax=Sphingobium nicotianae TaxID=2782607 RepID=A0A9X1AKC0_9SPHN|nr:hypothetical protein [Sphingobium nicotianae]
MAERIVSIGLLTRSDLQLLGQGFQRHFPITQDDSFSDLLAKLDTLAADTFVGEEKRVAEKE